MQKKFLTGSRAFFSCMADFRPKDTDLLVLDDAPKGYKFYRQTQTNGICLFEWRYMDADALIEYALQHQKPQMQVGKFLVPDFAKHIGLTLEQLTRLRTLIDALDAKHRYEEIIYNSYLVNGDFTLTDDQRESAYQCYKEART